MKNYEIWSEGYSASGDCSGATYHGMAKGRMFREACQNFAKQNPNFADYFDDDDGNGGDCFYWGCKLFDNESDARKNFG